MSGALSLALPTIPTLRAPSSADAFDIYIVSPWVSFLFKYLDQATLLDAYRGLSFEVFMLQMPAIVVTAVVAQEWYVRPATKALQRYLRARGCADWLQG